MGLIVAADWIWLGNRRVERDHFVEVPDDEAQQLISSGNALAKGDAPIALVTAPCVIRGETIAPGERVVVSPDTGSAILRRGEGILLGSPPAPTDPDFPSLPFNWSGGKLSDVLRLVADDPILRAFDALPPRYELKPEVLNNRFGLAGVTLSHWEKSFAKIPSGQPSSMPTPYGIGSIETPAGSSLEYYPPPTLADHQKARRSALAWWRRRRVHQLFVEVFDRLRLGLWRADGTVIHGGILCREPVPTSIWLADAMSANIRTNELMPSRKAPPGLPWFRDLELRSTPLLGLLDVDPSSAGSETRRVEADRDGDIDLLGAMLRYGPSDLVEQMKEAPDSQSLAVVLQRAAQTLLDRCLSGEMVMSGKRLPIEPSADRTVLDPESLAAFTLDVCAELLRPNKVGLTSAEYGLLRFRPFVAQPNWDAKTLVPIAATLSKATQQRPSVKAVKNWMLRRVANWPKGMPPPSEATDWRDAKAALGDGLTRYELRHVRSELTPEWWRKPGRRPKKKGAAKTR